ncbi:hypothetical protein BaRGS_00020448 [Batillaria attramentaria]|uniref:Uncharacterized protein n=1 Tax=Batillaria attramentaria TaxID=370345 RepID=A0ABD0KML9_9CAEN
MSVFIDGATISSLFYSHSGSVGNQEGFLFGRIINHVKDHISDSQINNSQVQTYVYVSSHLPWSSEDRVYSRGGVPIMEKLGSIAGEHKGEVIGWYSFRRGTSLRMSMKEKTLHQNLADRFCPQTPDEFLFCLCVSSASSDHSTHSMDHCFATLKRAAGQIKKLPVLVTNLGDTSHTEYTTHENMSGMQMGSVRAILNDFQPQFVSPNSEDMQEVERIDNMSGVLNRSLVKLCSQVVESERKTGALEEEVSVLKEKLRQRDEERERQRQSLLNPAEPVSAANTGGSSLKEVASLYPHLPGKVNTTALGKGESVSGELGTGSTSHLGHDFFEAGRKDCGLASAGKLGPSVDELLCVSEVSTSGDVHKCDSIRLVSQPDELIDLEASSSDGQNFKIKLLENKHKSDSVENGDSVTESVATHSKAHTKDAARVQNVTTRTKTKASAQTKPSDHFSFVEGMVKSASEVSSSKKTATVPTGQTLTYSPRTTRSQVKSETVVSKQTGRDKSKLPATGSLTDGTSNMAAASPAVVNSEGTGKSPSGGASSAPHDQGGSSLRPGASNADGSGAGYPPACGEPTLGESPGPQLRSSHPDQKGSASAAAENPRDSKVSKKLDPNTFNTGRQQNKTQMTTRSGRSIAGSKDHGVHENGMNTKEEAETQRSSSPVF